MSLYELAPGQGMVFHYHVQREELLVALRGTVSLRTANGWEDLPEGEVVAFPRGERGAHGFENRTDDTVRVLMVSEMNAPNISVYPDTNEIGVFDAALPQDRRVGALFRPPHTRSHHRVVVSRRRARRVLLLARRPSHGRRGGTEARRARRRARAPLRIGRRCDDRAR